MLIWLHTIVATDFERVSAAASSLRALLNRAGCLACTAARRSSSYSLVSF